MADLPTPLPGYLDRYDPADHYDEVLFRSDRFLQSAELNEMQTYLGARISGLAQVLMREGALVAGGRAVVDAETGATTVEDGSVYLRGQVRLVATRSFSVPVDRTVAIGVRLVEEVVTEAQDPELRGQIAGTRAQNEPGAARLRRVVQWGWDGDGLPGDFYAVISVDWGVIRDQTPPPDIDAFGALLARYDREAHGGYVVRGMRVLALGYSAGKQAFSISEGVANIWGYKITRDVAMRLVIDEDPDLEVVGSEPHEVTISGGHADIALTYGPIASVQPVGITAQKTVAVTHGAFSGAADALPDTSVLSIVSVTQGATTYVAGTDYNRVGDTVDWSPGGAEPAPGSSYQVTYRYLTTAVPTQLDERTIRIAGAVDGTLALVTYSFRLPRIDAVVIDRTGAISLVKGTSSRWSPQPPPVPPDMLRLADIYNLWGATPKVVNTRVLSIPFEDFRHLVSAVDDLYALIADERLRRDLTSREPVASRGVFVDPLLDDDMRDQGVPQTAALGGGEMRLPISEEVVSLQAGAQMLPYEVEVLLEQPLATATVPINPYQSFDPLPVLVALEPALDVWSETVTEWTSGTTERFVTSGGAAVSNPATSGSWTVTGTQTTSELVASVTERAEFLRVRDVSFVLEGFGPGEALQEVLFDGVAVTPTED